MRRSVLCPLLALGLALTLPARAHACGGLVSSDGSLGSDAQRAFYAVRGDRTELVLQIVVPQGGKGYGALVPLSAEPTIDSAPVAASDLEQLESATQPVLRDLRSSGGGGIGCGAAASDKALGGANGGGVLVGSTVAIGPVTAVSLSAATGAALRDWLTQNGYVVPAAAQRVVDGYAGAGRWLLALKRNDTPSAASSIGVHVTLPGDQRGFALRMAGISVSGKASFTVFVAAPAGVAPAAPFQAATLTDLNPSQALAAYPLAVESLVRARGGRAWLLEGVFDASAVLPAALGKLSAPGSKLTRLSAVFQAADLTEDVAFTASAPPSVPTQIVVSANAPPTLPRGGELLLLGAMAALLLGVRLSLRRPERQQLWLTPAPLRTA